MSWHIRHRDALLGHAFPDNLKLIAGYPVCPRIDTLSVWLDGRIDHLLHAITHRLQVGRLPHVINIRDLLLIHL
jgi:hypothetical protein